MSSPSRTAVHPAIPQQHAPLARARDALVTTCQHLAPWSTAAVIHRCLSDVMDDLCELCEPY